jgi:DNA-binding NtrC family response regulator
MYVICVPAAKSITDLENQTKVKARLTTPASIRAKFEIAVIDDQPFSPEQNLKNNYFQIRSFRDISSVNEIEQFPIVLCDLQGVGMNLAADLQGGYLIEEIKVNFPEKVVIAFTGGSTNSSIFKRATKFADNYIKKDATIDEWRDVLDKHIQQLSDPVYVWKQLRIRKGWDNATGIIKVRK